MARTATNERASWRLLLLATMFGALLAGASSCGKSDDAGADHKVFFVGYVYDGASGKRLAAADLTAISLKYRDKVIHTTLDSDGRFLTTEPLPTWQDYSVYVGAPGYRPFVSNNPGIDVPKAVQMTESANTRGTVQTLEFNVRLFPLDLKAPQVTITIEKSDALLATPPPARAAGTVRLTPTSASVVEQSSETLRVWQNDEDLLTQTVTKPFTDGAVSFDDGELLYGVTYAIAIFGVDGYQPFTNTSSQSGSSVIIAGMTTSLALTLQPDLKAPLRVLGTNSDKCTPPAPSANAYGAAIDITFSEEIEPAGPTFAEDVDNGVSISTGSTTTSYYYCPLNTSTDPTKQERGTKATISGRVLTLSFNPSVGLTAVTSSGTTCTPPPSITAVIYGLSNVFVQPKNDPVRKANVGLLVGPVPGSTTYPNTPVNGVSCPTRPSGSTGSF